MVAQDIWVYISDNLNPYADVTMDGLTTDQDSITILQGRGQPIVTEYMDGSTSGQFQFDVRAKSDDRVKANVWLQGVVDHFLTRPKIQLDNQTYFTAQPTISVYPIERTDRGEHVYAAGFVVEYDQF